MTPENAALLIGVFACEASDTFQSEQVGASLMLMYNNCTMYNCTCIDVRIRTGLWHNETLVFVGVGRLRMVCSVV